MDRIASDPPENQRDGRDLPIAEGLPTRRTSIEGETFEGDRLRLSFAIAKKLYRCPGCRTSIDVGKEHVFVHYRDADPPWDHEHWHDGCAAEKLLRSFSSRRAVPAPSPPRRGRHDRGRRRRR